MTVGAVQTHFRDLAAFLQAINASAATVNQLGEVVAGLEPFKEHAVTDFAAFLKLAAEIADEFRRTGQVPVPPVKKSRGTPRNPKNPKPSVSEIAAKVRGLYDRAAIVTDSLADLDDAMKSAGQLTVKDLKAIAANVNAALKASAKKDDILRAIRNSVMDRRGNLERINQ